MALKSSCFPRKNIHFSHHLSPCSCINGYEDYAVGVTVGIDQYAILRGGGEDIFSVGLCGLWNGNQE